jgi:hypothetical protein
MSVQNSPAATSTPPSHAAAAAAGGSTGLRHRSVGGSSVNTGSPAAASETAAVARALFTATGATTPGSAGATDSTSTRITTLAGSPNKPFSPAALRDGDDRRPRHARTTSLPANFRPADPTLKDWGILNLARSEDVHVVVCPDEIAKELEDLQSEIRESGSRTDHVIVWKLVSIVAAVYFACPGETSWQGAFIGAGLCKCTEEVQDFCSLNMQMNSLPSHLRTYTDGALKLTASYTSLAEELINLYVNEKYPKNPKPKQKSPDSATREIDPQLAAAAAGADAKQADEKHAASTAVEATKAAGAGAVAKDNDQTEKILVKPVDDAQAILDREKLISAKLASKTNLEHNPSVILSYLNRQIVKYNCVAKVDRTLACFKRVSCLSSIFKRIKFDKFNFKVFYEKLQKDLMLDQRKIKIEEANETAQALIFAANIIILDSKGKQFDPGSSPIAKKMLHYFNLARFTNLQESHSTVTDRATTRLTEKLERETTKRKALEAEVTALKEANQKKAEADATHEREVERPRREQLAKDMEALQAEAKRVAELAAVAVADAKAMSEKAGTLGTSIADAAAKGTEALATAKEGVSAIATINAEKIKIIEEQKALIARIAEIESELKRIASEVVQTAASAKASPAKVGPFGAGKASGAAEASVTVKAVRDSGATALDRLDFREHYTDEVPLDTIKDLTAFHVRQRQINGIHNNNVERLGGELGKIKVRLAAIERGVKSAGAAATAAGASAGKSVSNTG